MGLVPTPGALQLSRPSGSALAEASDHFQEAVPTVAGASWRRRVCEDAKRLRRRHDVIEYTLCRTRTEAGDQLHHPKPRDPVTGVLHEAQHRQEILDVGGLEEFEPAELDEGNVPP